MKQYEDALARIEGVDGRYVVVPLLTPFAVGLLRNDGYFCSTFEGTTIVSKPH